MNDNNFQELLLNQLSEINNRLSKMDDRLRSVEKETTWIRGKLEGRGEFWTDIKSWIAIAVATAAAILAWVK